MKLAYSNKGAVSVEFALVLAFILVPLFIGLVDAGRLLNAKVVLNRAAREGAVAVMRGKPYVNAIQNVITDAGFNVGALSVTVEVTSSGAGETRTLQLSYTIPNFPMFNYPGVSFPNPITAQATYQQP